jgi:ketosteroid isomerase-like protein
MHCKDLAEKGFSLLILLEVLSLVLASMNINEQVIVSFYTAFQKRDYQTMQNCYSDKVIFYDPVFEDLIDDEVKWMWEMLCTRAVDLSIKFSEVEADDEYGTCNWVASYTFTKTNRKVVNKIKAHMRFNNGKIIEHSDQFKLSNWCKQALGLPGILFGSMAWFQKRVKRSAQQSLYDFIVAKQGSK